VTLRKLHAHVVSPREGGTRTACSVSTKQDRQCTYNVTLRGVRATIVVVKKQLILHKLSVSVALGIQHVMRMRHIAILARPALQYFSILSHEQHDFRGGGGFNILYKFCSKHFSLQEEISEIRCKMCIGVHVKYPLFLSDFNET
jgi:hypothetical protein